MKILVFNQLFKLWDKFPISRSYCRFSALELMLLVVGLFLVLHAHFIILHFIIAYFVNKMVVQKTRGRRRSRKECCLFVKLSLSFDETRGEWIQIFIMIYIF